MAKQKGMSFVEKAGLFFGVVGVMADFTALVSFTYGFANLNQFIPSHVSSDSATSFFKWFSGLMIIYGWFIASWYLTRRTFVLRYERPRAYKNPLSSRSVRTIFGIGLFLVPTFIFWSIVNVSFTATARYVVRAIGTPTPTLETPEASETKLATLTSDMTPIITETPEIVVTSTPIFSVDIPTETLTPVASETVIAITPTAEILPIDQQQVVDSSFAFLYYILVFPIVIFFFGLVIYASINSLMPIVHVELLDDYE